MKKDNRAERDPLASCSFCEHARISEGDQIYCEKYRKDIIGRDCCSDYIYDLTKRQPLRLRSSCHLTEALLEDGF